MYAENLVLKLRLLGYKPGIISSNNTKYKPDIVLLPLGYCVEVTNNPEYYSVCFEDRENGLCECLNTNNQKMVIQIIKDRIPVK